MSPSVSPPDSTSVIDVPTHPSCSTWPGNRPPTRHGPTLALVSMQLVAVIASVTMLVIMIVLAGDVGGALLCGLVLAYSLLSLLLNVSRGARNPTAADVQ